ncbi:hypothetical protein [Actinokineospora diospyrosa]|uniref:hypothetical protein n=1 Tax=Actinokineospora diospyrosa TaxID=103728 RepID=UPI0020A5896A|nr:hypothetical protein [Actinokineospora diospyrosa]
MPTWTPLENKTPLSFDYGARAVGWDRGFLVAKTIPDNPPAVHVSKDGVDWRVSTSPDFTWIASTVGTVAAGYGPAAYVAGWSARGPVVWRTEDGAGWDSVPLARNQFTTRSPFEADTAIVAGPRGVLLVAWGRALEETDPDIYVWYSPDGKSFPAAVARSIPLAVGKPRVVTAAATPEGFLLAVSDPGRATLLQSADGKDWQDLSGGFPQGEYVTVETVAGNARTVVVERQIELDPDNPSDEPRIWYRRDGSWHAARVDPGQLPDAGVVPVSQRDVWAIRPWGAGFVAVGETLGDVSGVVWHSADGADFTRLPARANGFDRAMRITDVAVSGTTAIAFGMPVQRLDAESADAVLWRTDPP